MLVEHGTGILDAFILGAALGGIYFISLWVTVRRLIFTARPIFLSVLSMYARLAGTGFALSIIMDGSALRLAAAITGFMIARAIAVKFAIPAGNTTSP